MHYGLKDYHNGMEKETEYSPISKDLGSQEKNSTKAESPVRDPLSVAVSL